jgi:hypothetical protein
MIPWIERDFFVRAEERMRSKSDRSGGPERAAGEGKEGALNSIPPQPLPAGRWSVDSKENADASKGCGEFSADLLEVLKTNACSQNEIRFLGWEYR